MWTLSKRTALLGSTALLAVGLAAGQATCADKIRVGLGGYFNAFFVYGDQDDGEGEAAEGRRDHKIAREAEVAFFGETVLDNGLTVGVNIKLEAETCDDQIDESYVYFEGSYGRLEVGSEDPAPDAMFYGAPVPIAGVGLSTPDDVFASLTNSVGTPATIVNISGDAEKLTYFTPRIAGIQLGLSYTPDNCEENSAGGDSGFACGGSYSGFQSEETPGQQSESIEIGVNYVNSFGDVDIGAYAGYAAGDLEVSDPAAEDQNQWGLGFEVGYAGFTFGAEYKEDDQGSSGRNTDRTDWAVGLAYGQGPWTVGVQYVNAEVEEGDGLGEDETEGFQVGGTYNLGPGVLLTGGVTIWDVRDNLDDPASENDATSVIIGTIIEF